MNPVLMEIMPFLILTAGLCLSVLLFVLTKGEIFRQRRAAQLARKELELTVQLLQSEVTQLRHQVGSPAELPSSIPRPGLNLNRRTQVLRMSRRGDRSHQIAAALGVPQNEVDLLLKLHQQARTASV